MKARRVVLMNRPAGEPAESDFRVEPYDVPEPGPLEVLVRVVYMSLDPYMRGRMNDVKSRTSPPVADRRGDDRRQTVGEVVEVARFRASKRRRQGRWPSSGWQLYGVAQGQTSVHRIDPSHRAPASYYQRHPRHAGDDRLWFGLFDMRRAETGRNGRGQSAASGAVGQRGRAAWRRSTGCRVGGHRRRQGEVRLTSCKELGFDACVDHKRGQRSSPTRCCKDRVSRRHRRAISRTSAASVLDTMLAQT